ncbi:MAG: hypothetical protein M9924_04335 [Rhizobiaceae bacterium]|nr:hypothetical protein [Rhizobiaceae bacterium]
MDSTLLAVVTAFFGAAIGFMITRLNDWIVERRELQRASRHLRTEAANAVRHYTAMRDRLAGHLTQTEWLNAIYIETCRFYGSGLGTFDLSTLRLFDEDTAEEALFLLLMIRNNNSYVDQAKLYFDAGKQDLFHDVCEALVVRCQSTVERAQHLEERLRTGSSHGKPSAPVL